MSFEEIYHKGKKMKRDTKALTGEIIVNPDIEPGVVWFINPNSMYTGLGAVKLKNVLTKDNK